MTPRTKAILAVGVVAIALLGAVQLRAKPDRAAETSASTTTVGASGESSEKTPPAPTQSRGAVADTASATEIGAVDAAIELATAPQTWLYLSDEELEAAVRNVAAPSSADHLVDEIMAEVGLARDALARSPGRIWWVVSPLAWRVDTFGGERAEVSVWTVSVLSAADVAMPQSDWTTTVLDLEWDATTWRLVATRDTPGPTPQLGGRDEAWQPEPFDDALAGFVRVGAEPL